MKKRWIAIGIWSIGAILIGTGQLLSLIHI